MFRHASLTCSGARRRLWIAVATVAGLLVTAAPAQAAQFAYVTHHVGKVSQYRVGAGGLLAPMAPATVDAGGGEPASVAVSLDGESVYVTNRGAGISQYDVGPGGELTPKSPATVAAGDAPSKVAVSPDGQSVYVTNADDYSVPAYDENDAHGSVSQYDVGPGGELSPKSPATVSTGHLAPFGVAVSPDGQSVYVTNYDSNNVSQFDVGPGGELSLKSPASVASGDHPTAVAVSSDGESVYVTDYIYPFDGTSTVSQYDVGAGGALSPKSPATVAAGDGASEVAVSQDGKSVYVTNAFDGRVSQYDVGAGGVLSPKSPATVAAGGGAGSLAVSPDGGSVYVVNTRVGGFYSHDGSVSQYDVGAGGVLSPKSPATVVPSAADPRAIAVSPGAPPPLKCSVFGSQARAQSVFLNLGGPRHDRYALDRDNDGLACEARGAPYRGLLKVKYRAGHFKGRLKAVTGSCRGDRRIKVYKKRNAVDRLVAKDRTKSRGFYRVQKDRPSKGKVYAKSRSQGKCRKDRSFRTIRF